jgi:formylglycine-generating enzyme required for sulfatase activity
MRARFLLVPALTVGLCFIATGCGEDAVIDAGAPSATTIVIDPDPDNFDIPWQITGPDGFMRSGDGDSTLSEIDPGDYTLTWGTVPGWFTPEPAAVTRTLASGGALTFTALYTVKPRTITIDPAPNTALANWELTGPGGFSLADTGNVNLPDLEPGEYTLIWNAVQGWASPDPAAETRTLTSDGAVMFTGLYTVTLEMRYIAPGVFLMGSPADEPTRDDDEARHEVTLTRGYWISIYEVSETIWSAVMGEEPTSSLLPKSDVTWSDAVEFCNVLSALKGLTPAYAMVDSVWTWQPEANGYRLPTEAEWEYACRAGTTTATANGPLTTPRCEPLDPSLNAMAWYCGNSDGDGSYCRHPVGLKQPNTWGLYDMHGNVSEWCWDWYGPYPTEPIVDPLGSATGYYHVIRGGDFASLAQDCRSARRYPYYLNWPILSIGVRVVRTAE